MHVDLRLSTGLSYTLLLLGTASAAPSERFSTNVGKLESDISRRSTTSSFDSSLKVTQDREGLGVNSSHPNPSSNLSAHDLTFTTVTWPITSNLYLIANIGPWVLSTARIIETLEAANTTVGKKVSSQVLEKKFQQEQGSRINTMIFEIGPGYIDKKLTWGDVALVLGSNGLLRFFEEYGHWTSTYFDVMDKSRGMLGNGAVRKWYQLLPPTGQNGTALRNGGIEIA